MLACVGLLLNSVSADKGLVHPKIRVTLSAVAGLGTAVLEERERRTVTPYRTRGHSEPSPTGIAMHGEPKTFSVSLVSTSAPTKCVIRAADGRELDRFKFHPLLIFSPTPCQDCLLAGTAYPEIGPEGRQQERKSRVSCWRRVGKTLRTSLWARRGMRESS